MGYLLSYKYWLNLRPGSMEAYFSQGLIIFIAILLAMFFVSYLNVRSKKGGIYLKIWQKLKNFSFGNFFIGIFLFFFLYEQLPFLSMRLWELLWVAGMLTWIYFIARLLIKIPEMKKKFNEEKQFKKYLP